MKRIFAIAVVASLIGFFATANGQSQTKLPDSDAAAQNQVKLPESKTAAVFTMEYSGGFRRATPKDWVKQPHLQVFADGRVVNAASTPEEEDYEFQLKPKQLQEFLKQVVDRNKFYELDTDKIKKEIAAAGQAARIADASTLELKVELPRGSHAVSIYAIKSTAKQFPKIKGLQQIARIENLGRNLVLTANAGGYEKVDRALLKVNEQLKEKGLDLMTINELYTCKQQDGILTINFNRKYYNKDGQWRDWINAKFTAEGDDESVEVKTNIETDKTMSKPENNATKTDDK